MPGRVLYWWTNDLRMRDNRALQCCKSYDALLNVYVVDPAWFRTTLLQSPLQSPLQSSRMGAHRWEFIHESLESLSWQLRKLGQTLRVVYGNPSEVLTQLAIDHSIDVLHTARSPGYYEQATLEHLSKTVPSLDLQLFDQTTLFTKEQIHSQLMKLPGSFSKFEKKVLDWEVEEMSALPDFLPKQTSPFLSDLDKPPLWFKAFVEKKGAGASSENHWAGGEVLANDHLETYFTSELPTSYLATRNSLEGWESSTKLSAYLSQGCLSPKQIYKKVRNYASKDDLTKEEIKSVNWILKEILWREYFQWLGHEIGVSLYKFKGLSPSSPLTSFYPARFKKWCEGTTPYPIVNACMRELKETGFLSNRGRQIAASCLVNELGMDWRYGAAWFEEHLIDYDVASNWGNWQYIAGVGVDPRGGRHFNLEKQAALYDPEGSYVKQWLGDETPHPLDSVDMVDWPIA